MVDGKRQLKLRLLLSKFSSKGRIRVVFSNKERQQIIQRLTHDSFDVLIIGGGITGAGIALDATTRGLKTALVEMQDFSAGTSSRSTKLIHGGLRYLKQLEIRLVAEIGKERAIVYENGPHVTKPIRMLLPCYRGGEFGKLTTAIGLTLYDFLAGVKKAERKLMLSSKETIAAEPLLKKQGLEGGGTYVEYRTDDARLTIEVVKAAVDHGAFALNYSKVESLLYQDGKVAGAKVKDQLTGEEYSIKAQKVINAAGPWGDLIREKDQSKAGKFLTHTKGIHIVVDRSILPLKQAIYFESSDGRMIFAIPRDRKTYVGTTDTFYHWDLAKPYATSSDLQYLLEAIHYMFPSVSVDITLIESSWAGVRPLISENGKNPSEISRKDEIWESKTGLITIAGGKLTGYRKMAEMVVDLLVKKRLEEGKLSFKNCQTKNLSISGGEVGGSENFHAFVKSQIEIGLSEGLNRQDASHLAYTYGSNVGRLFEIIKEMRKTERRNDIPIVLFAKLQYALQSEMAVTPLDFFVRRTGMFLFDISGVKAYKDSVIQYMADYFGWEKDVEIGFRKELEDELISVGSPIED